MMCAFGGVLSCGITHTAVTPLDLVKCRIQVNYCYDIVYFLMVFLKEKRIFFLEKRNLTVTLSYFYILNFDCILRLTRRNTRILCTAGK